MDIETETLSLSVTKETARMLRAFTKVSNGSIHNQADAAIRKGIAAACAAAPLPFVRKFLAELEETV